MTHCLSFEAWVDILVRKRIQNACSSYDDMIQLSGILYA